MQKQICQLNCGYQTNPNQQEVDSNHNGRNTNRHHNRREEKNDSDIPVKLKKSHLLILSVFSVNMKLASARHEKNEEI